MKILDFAFTNIQSDNVDLGDLRSYPKTLIVDENEYPVEVAKKVAAQKAHQVIVTGPQEAVLGVIIKRFIDDQLTGYAMQHASDLSEGIIKLAQSRSLKPFDFPGQVRPQLFYCAKGKHYTSEYPCSEHP